MMNGNTKSATSNTCKHVTKDFSVPTNGTSELAVPILEPSTQAQEIFKGTSLSLVQAMQYSKAGLYFYQEVGKCRHMLSSKSPKSHDNLPNCKLYGINIVLGSRVNAPIWMASPWSNCVEVQRDKFNTRSDVWGATKLLFYNTNVLGSEGTAD